MAVVAAASAAPGGARPNLSILADYAACLPVQSAWHAARNGHWRAAAVSLLSTLFVLLPALGGGIFMALTVAPGDVRMLPNIAVYAVVLTLLVLYLLALVAMLPGRRAFRLPHAVTCLAEIISFVATEDLMADDSFKEVWHKTSLRGKIGVDMRPDVQPRWFFGPGPATTRAWACAAPGATQNWRAAHEPAATAPGAPAPGPGVPGRAPTAAAETAAAATTTVAAAAVRTVAAAAAAAVPVAARTTTAAAPGPVPSPAAAAAAAATLPGTTPATAPAAVLHDLRRL